MYWNAAAQGLRDAARDWSEWEVFDDVDGHKSIRMHGMSPDEWMEKRANDMEIK